jgi:hypothetical protein
MTKTELLNKVIEELAGSNTRTTKQFSSIISQFYTSSGGDFTRRAVVNYITKMAQKGYAPGTNRLHFRVLKRGFEIAGKIDPSIEWPFSKRAPVEIDTALADIPWQESKIAFSAEDIKQLIDAAKEGKLSGVANALVALSTTYGLRRIEMADLDSDSLNLKTKRLRVLTKHGSRLREHIIPSEIVEYLKDYRPLRSEFKLSEIFHDIEKASGLPERYGTGWHCIRRGLVNNLVKVKLDVPEQQALLYIYDYLRWKKSMTFGMLGTYFTEDFKVVDEAILKAHPFIGYWK